jgi:CheY-like chemotaxis protein
MRLTHNASIRQWLEFVRLRYKTKTSFGISLPALNRRVPEITANLASPAKVSNGLEIAGIYHPPNVCDLSSATDGLEALKRVGSTTPKVIVTDLKMPKMDGIQLLQDLRKIPRTFPVVVMSSNGDPIVRLKCAGLGIESFLDKPVTLEGLRESLQYVLELATNFRR